MIVNMGCETPRINYEFYNGKPYNYFYAISSDVDADNPGMVSHDRNNFICMLTENWENCHNF